MATHAVDGPILLAKKLGGVILMILGGLVAALGADMGSSATIAIGILFVVAGAVFLVLKILRRNDPSQIS